MEREQEKLPETRSIAVRVPKVDLMSHSNPKDHIHKEDPQEEVPVASVSSQAEHNRQFYNLIVGKELKPVIPRMLHTNLAGWEIIMYTRIPSFDQIHKGHTFFIRLKKHTSI